MGKASRQLDADRAARNKARKRFESHLVSTRQDLTGGAIAARLFGRLRRKSRGTLDEAVEIADENRMVVAGTIAALAAWFLRKPILSWLAGRLAGSERTEDIADGGN